MNRIRKSWLGIVAALLVAFVGVAYAQQGLIVQGVATTTWGIGAAAYSDTDGVIKDGTVVIFDTTSTRARAGVLPYPGTVLSRPYVVGIAWGDIPKKSSGVAGKVLLWGYHNNVKMAASGYSANTLVKVGVVHGAIATEVDTLSLTIGRFISYNSSSTAANNRGKVFISTIGARSALLKN